MSPFSGQNGFIGGGTTHLYSGSYSSMIGGGSNELSGSYAATAGGQDVNILGNHAFIGGGQNHQNNADHALIGGGLGHEVAGQRSAIAGGQHNLIGTLATHEDNFIGGGEDHTITGANSSILGGQQDSIASAFAFIGGGRNHVVLGDLGFVGGGDGSEIQGNANAVLGGYAHQLSNTANAAVGGRASRISGENSFIGGGSEHIMSGLNSGILGGGSHQIDGSMSVIAGGANDTISGRYAFIGGGVDHKAEGLNTFIGGGVGNVAPSFAETVFGHFSTSYTANNVASIDGLDRLFVVGNGSNRLSRANALTILKNGNTSIGDDAPGNFKLKVRQTGTFGLAIENNTGTNWELRVNGSGSLVLYYNGAFRGTFNTISGAYSSTSDHRLKTDIEPLSNVLGKVAQLGLSSYHYKQDPHMRPHIGLVAQQAATLFPELVTAPQSEQETYTVDYSGFSMVALKAIQEQQAIIEQQQGLIELLMDRVDQLEQE